MTVTTDETGNEGTVEVTEQPPEEKESDAKGNEGSGLEKDTEEEEEKEEEEEEEKEEEEDTLSYSRLLAYRMYPSTLQPGSCPTAHQQTSNPIVDRQLQVNRKRETIGVKVVASQA